MCITTKGVKEFYNEDRIYTYSLHVCYCRPRCIDAPMKIMKLTLAYTSYSMLVHSLLQSLSSSTCIASITLPFKC